MTLKKKFGHELMGKFWPKVYPILQGENGKNKPVFAIFLVSKMGTFGKSDRFRTTKVTFRSKFAHKYMAEFLF